MKYNNVLFQLDDNMMKVFTHLFRKGPLTVNELTKVTGMPRTTMNRNIKELVELDLIQQDTTYLSTGGRPPLIYSLNPNGVYMVGMELSRSNIRVVICNIALEPIWVYDRLLDGDSSPQIIFESLFKELSSNMENLGVKKDRFIGIGIGSVGPLDMSQGILLNPSGFPNDQWHYLSLKQLFEENFNTPTFVANGASTAVMGEYASHISKEITNTIYINIGVGIRVGVISNGSLLGGDVDREGAYGHLIVNPGGRSCYCGKYGCIESYSSVPSIVKSFHKELKKDEPVLY